MVLRTWMAGFDLMQRLFHKTFVEKDLLRCLTQQVQRGAIANAPQQGDGLAALVERTLLQVRVQVAENTRIIGTQ